MNKQFAKLNNEKYKRTDLEAFIFLPLKTHFPNDEIRMMKSGYDVHNTHVTLN